MDSQTLSVSQFLAILNQTLDYAYPVVQIEGEVSSFKVNQQKYVFFDLKDDEGTVGCFMSVWQLRTQLEDGMRVVVSAKPKVTPWGKFSLTIQSVRPVGEGSIKRSFDLLKNKLGEEGLFDEDRKRTLPKLPRHVAVISSTQAAGYADFIKIVNQRMGGMQIDVAHVQVQGDVASDQIIRAIEHFNSQSKVAEVLVLIRGGGSADDLAAFNDERLVRAIATSRIPTLVGVGHEVDTTLADMVADVRAATPSNAAEILVPDRYEMIAQEKYRLHTMAKSIERAIDMQLRDDRLWLVRAHDRIIKELERQISDTGLIRETLKAYDPRSILKRGYAIVRGKIDVGQSIEIETLNYHIDAEVKNVRSNN